MNIKFISICLLSTFVLFSCGTNTKTTDKSESKNDYTIDFYKSGSNLKELVSKIKSEGETPVLYFTASWCGPCREFKKTIDSKEMQTAFKDAKLIIIDTDIDKQRDKISYLYSIGGIPTFIKVDENAEPLKTMVGGDWREPTPARVAASMRLFIK